ncbi:MAG: T9SS type A sorting domain-containing protein [bacterium]|nr:T9SS type A sorting domain-containing protein [bacterium]
MKILYIIQALLLFPVVIFSQTDEPVVLARENGIDIEITFKSEPFLQKLDRDKRVIEYINSLDESQPGTPVLPTKTYFVAIPPLSKIKIHSSSQKYNYIKDIGISFNPEIFLSQDSILSYRKTTADLENFSFDEYPTQEIETVGYTWIRNYYCAAIRINTHRFNWKKKEIREIVSSRIHIDFTDIQSYPQNTGSPGQFDEILKDVILNYETASQFKADNTTYYPADTSGNWIDYSKEYVKLQIADDGIYRIDHDQIINYGINPHNINPKTFKVFAKGKEIPLFVLGQNDLSFDPGDYIEFWAERNYGSSDYKEIVNTGEDYLNYFDRYSDTSIVWLSWNGNEGERIFEQNLSNPGITDTLQHHKAFYHIEEDVRLWYYDAVSPRVQLPNWQENKVWTWHFLGNGGSVDINFNSTNFVQDSPVKITARMISNATDGLFTNNHRFGLSLNSGLPEDTIVFSFKETVNFSAEYISNQLISGNNFVRIFGMQNDSLRWHQGLVDWVDIEYDRYNTAENDSLLIRVPENNITSAKVIKVSNITQDSSDIIIYKIGPNYKKINSFNVSNSVLTFSDTVSANDRYMIIQQALVKTPAFVTKKFFINLRDQNRGADYIAISNRILQSSSEEYLNFIDNNYDTRNELIYIDDIYDEFSFGFNKPEAIKDFLLYANLNWIFPSPSYLLLIGDANYDYKNKITPPPVERRKNLVPSYGNPVSDVWFTMWDTSNVNLPQMFVGRLPVTSNEDLNLYLNKHQVYINRVYDDFNKRYLFFSGGDPGNPGQLELLKTANSNVLNNLIKPAPIGGEGVHFYKTIDPPSNFGPYTREQIDNAIDSSGLFISYIGHSGTETWDNGITDVADLKSSFNDRLSLITDFGCSTGKFAEPDVDAFGELFVSGSVDGQSIAYLGNASWGYVSTSVNYPQLFYTNLLSDSLPVISRIHYLAKMQLLNQFGTGDVNRVFNYSNILFGDPIIEFRLPQKPNITITEQSFRSENNFPLDTDDSVKVNVGLFNYGKVQGDSVLITIVDNHLGVQKYFLEYYIPLPLYKKDILLSIPISGLVGEHNLQVTLDKDNKFDEIYENDNSASFNFVVYSSSVRTIEAERFYNSSRAKVKLLNPVFLPEGNITSMQINISDNPDFINPLQDEILLDTLSTHYQLLSTQPNKRYWLQARINSFQSNWSEPFSFFNTNVNYDWYFGNSFNPEDVEFNNISFDSTNNGWQLKNYTNILEITSAGFNDGGFGSIKLNDLELLPNSYYWGIATAVIDSITLNPTDFRYFVYHEPMIADSLLIAYIDSLPVNTLLAMTLATDGAQSVLGWSSGTPVRQAIESLGSLYIDSVFYRDSWCMIGKKGASQGTVLESFSKSSAGFAMIDTNVFVSFTTGWIQLPQIKNAHQWLSVTKIDSLPSGSEINYIPIGIKSDNTTDTLNALTFSGNTADIKSINANTYPSIKILTRIIANDDYETPAFKELGIDFIPVPDLATNYQVVSATDDSVLIGENIGLTFYVYNVGESKADSFSVKVEVINEDNTRQTILTQKVDSLSPGSQNRFDIVHNTSSGSGAKTFLINIDSENQIRELFEDNNFFSVPFYVKPDTSQPTLNLTIDGNDILDGEYISAEPVIHIELNDQSLLPITEPSSVMVYLNDELIPPDTSVITYTFSETNPKVSVDFTPVLVDGEYNLKVLWRDYEGNIVDSSGVEKFFLVSNEAKILNVYNYPNPTTGETHFTFKLTQIPEEIRIKIFTIAGRLVKEIKLTGNDLKYDFNKIYWDGRDEDNDLLGNGVYLYKVIMNAGDKTEEVTQKLAVVK